MKRLLALLLAVLFLSSFLAACNRTTGSDGELKKGTIIKGESEDTGTTGWKPLTSTARAELDGIYQQKLAVTKAFAAVPVVAGKTYYISSIHGNDSNNGKSPESAWATPQMANGAAVKSGDLVLFECGSEFRRTSNDVYIQLKSGVTYATYGTGEKPIFYGSLNASGSNNWQKVSGKENLYYFKTPISSNKDVGSIVFNGGEAWGIKIQMTYKKDTATDQYTIPANETLALSGVYNKTSQTQPIDIPSYPLKSGTDLKGPDLSFYHDLEYVYLYCEGGNPGARFDSIEIALPGYAFTGTGISNATILNLDFRVFGDHVIRPTDSVNLTVKNCSFFFVGGTIMRGFAKTYRNYDTRLGDAIENWNSCDGMVVENCFFDQVFDTPMTTQSNSEVSSKNIAYRNNVVQNTWYGVELWTVNTGVEFSNVDVSGNYFKNIGEGFTTTRYDKIDPGIDYPINGFIEIGSKNHIMSNCSATDNIVDGTTASMIFCLQLKTKDNPNGFLFDRNTYVGKTNVNFGHFYARLQEGTAYPYTSEGIATVQSLGVESEGTFYYTRATADSNEVDRLIDSLPTYTYQAANGVTLPFRLFFPEGDTEGTTYPLVTVFNRESASGNDNIQNVMTSKTAISELISENRAILLVPQCPSGTWTGIPVSNGNYSTAETTETDVMKAVSALIRDVAETYKTGKKYAIGWDAGAYAVSDLLVRHKNLLAAGIVISGAGDPTASIGSAEVMVIHSGNDEVVSPNDADALAKAWNARYLFYDGGEYWSLQHDCWEYAAKNEDLLGWLLTK